MNDDFLYKFHKAPRREFAAKLYERISKPMKTTSRIKPIRSAAMAVVLLLVIGATLYFAPATRALADSIIHQFGAFLFVQAPPEPKPLQNEMAAKQPSDGQEKKDPLLDQAEQSKEQSKAGARATVGYARDASAASQLSGFTVLAPSYLPDGYQIESASEAWTVLHESNEVRTSVSYGNQDESSFLTIEQLKHQPGESKQVESLEITDVIVRGQPGIWVPDHQKNLLVWEENGITYLVISNTLPLEEVLNVAESLGK
jgi:hypothetical protein